MLTPAELKELSAISSVRSTAAILCDWLLIACAWALAIRFPQPWAWALAFFAISRQQLALAILMHDGAHRRLYASGRANDWIGQFTLAAPLLFAMDSYKKLHLKHHLRPLAEDDPDLSLIGGYPISRSSLLRKLLRDLAGLSYFKFIRYFVYMARRKSVAPPSGEKRQSSQGPRPGLSKTTVLASILIMQGAIFGVLAGSGHPWLYLTLWILPFMTLLQVLLRIRGLAEHAGYGPGEDQRLNARTVINPWQTWIFAPHQVFYHIEHHVYPSVPFYRLKRLHRLMVERGVLPASNVYRGYGQVLADLVR